MTVIQSGTGNYGTISFGKITFQFAARHLDEQSSRAAERSGDAGTSKSRRLRDVLRICNRNRLMRAA